MTDDKENVTDMNSKMKKYVLALGACMVIFAVLAVAVSDNAKTETQPTTLPAPETQTKGVEAEAENEPDTRDKLTIIVPATQITQQTVVTTQGTTESTTKGAPVSYSLPLGTDIGNDYSQGIPVYNEALADWRTHNGVDFKGEYGDSVKCIADGIVKEIREDPVMGGVIVVEHGGGVESTYCGVIASDDIAEDIFVAENDMLGTLSSIPSENAEDYPHLHLEITVNGKIQDPLEIMGRN